MKIPKYILPIIVIAQFFCTSTWFAANAVMGKVIFSGVNTSNIITSVQIGFILGTLSFAVLTISDRFSPSKVFFISALLASVSNFLIVIEEVDSSWILATRFSTGFFLAGIYPVGMKIAADHYEKGLGKSLGFLVGALTLGTAFPHLLNYLSFDFSWKYVIYATSILCLMGGAMIYIFVPDGPYRKISSQFSLNTAFQSFKNKDFRSVALGYFGHMWELYAFWAMAYHFAQFTFSNNSESPQNSLLAFFIIASGLASCIIAGQLSQKFNTKKLAKTILIGSALCCILSPVFFVQDSIFKDYLYVKLVFIVIWGMLVIADSPLFSTLVAQNASAENRGSALILVNCIGFSLTILSLQFLKFSMQELPLAFAYMALAIGPILGIIALREKKSLTNSNLV